MTESKEGKRRAVLPVIISVVMFLAVAATVAGCSALRDTGKTEESTKATKAAETTEITEATKAAETAEITETTEITEPAEEISGRPGQGETPAAAREVPVYKGTAAAAGRLPAAYDARKDGRTSPVKDQGDLGTCWAFASLLALESALLPDEALDFSEDHMSNNPSFNLGQEEGGEYTMSMAYLLAWKGPVLEADDPYGDGFSPEGLRAVKHVQEIQMIPSRDLEAIKRAVYACGGVQSSLHTTLTSNESESEYYDRETRAYCYPTDTAPNHDVVIVGWDDDFSKEAFPVEVAGDGAFLCENSWGTQFGEDGYFYVSYYDANIGKNNILYSSVEAADNYDHIYQSDLCGWIGQLGYGGDTAWAVNIYQAAGRQRLEAAGFYATAADTEYEVYVVRHVPEEPDGEALADRKLAARGKLGYAGFYTVPLTGDFALEQGERFGVMIKLVTPGVIHPIAIEYDAGDGKCKVDLEDGEGYISLEGEQWQHVEAGQRCNLCLKAYTSDN